MRKTIRNTVLKIAGAQKSIGKGVHILNSHYISRDNAPQEIFYDLLKKLNKSADFINIQDAVKLIESKNSIDQKLIAFTFDDGFEECYTKVAPVLKDFNTNAAFFINPGFIDGSEEYKKNFLKNTVHLENKNPMNWEMIKSLHQDGFIIGNHTLDHSKLVDLSQEEINNQIINSKAIIEKQIDAKCDYFAWTYGKLSDIDDLALNVALNEHKYVFSSDSYKDYYSLNNRVFNRRHIEGDWPISHVKYFLSHTKKY